MMDFDFLNGIDSILGNKKENNNNNLFDSDAEVVDKFVNKHEFLSNFFGIPQKSTIYFEDENKSIQSEIESFKSVEHAFQASRTLNREQQLEIMEAGTAKQAQRLGKKVDLIDNWEVKMFGIMERLVDDKFIQNFPLKLKLLATGSAKLENGNSWGDDFWGVTKNGGENNLGKLLMKLRRRVIKDEGEILYHISDVLDRQGLGFVVDWIDKEKIAI